MSKNGNMILDYFAKNCRFPVLKYGQTLATTPDEIQRKHEMEAGIKPKRKGFVRELQTTCLSRAEAVKSMGGYNTVPGDGPQRHYFQGDDLVGKKKQVLLALFQSCMDSGNYEFDNDKVREVCQQVGFSNQFDVTKLDNTNSLPDEIKDEGYCVVHLGDGQHRFMQVLDVWFHTFEEIEQSEKHPWDYTPSLLNHTDTSESNIISLVYNQLIIQDFLYGDKTEKPKIYMPRRTKITATYQVHSDRIEATKLQMEMDATFEHRGVITVLEGKNGFPDNFAVYQLFHPFLDYQKVSGVQQVQCCYLLKEKNDEQSYSVRLYLYTFSDNNDIGSIELIKKSQYDLRERER